MNKKITALVLILTMLLALLAGCGGTAADPTEAPATKAPATQAPGSNPPREPETPEEPTGYTYPLPGETKTISIWTPSQPDVVNLMETFANHKGVKYAEEAINVEIEWHEVSSSAAKEQYFTMVAGGEYPDIIREVASKYTDKGDLAIEEEVIIDVAELLPTKMPDYWALIENHVAKESILRQMTTDAGKIGYIYSLVDEWIGADPAYGPEIRADWLDKLNMDKPQTYDELYEVLTAFKTEFDCSDPILMPCTCLPMTNYLVRGFDTTGISASEWPMAPNAFMVKDGEITHALLNDGYKEYITMLNKWFNEGLINVDFYSRPRSWKDAVNTGLILNGEAGVIFNDMTAIADLNGQATIEGFRLEGIEDPRMSADQVTHLGGNFTGVGGGNLSITTQCEDLDTVFAFLNYWYTEEGILLTNYGIEGDTYTMVDGKPQYTEVITVGDGEMTFSQRRAMNLYGNCGNYSITKRFDFIYSDIELEARQMWMQTDDGDYYLMAKMNEEESAEYSPLYADVLTYIQERLLRFVNGELSIENDWDDMVQGAIDMGLDRCIELWQSAQDRYDA